MWYVMQVFTGNEFKVVECIEKLARFSQENAQEKYVKPYKRLLVPQYEVKKKFQGEWKMRTEILFPGYVFVETRDVKDLAHRLRKVPMLTKLLATQLDDGDACFIPLSQREMDLILSFVTPGTQVVEMSEGVLEGDTITIVRGPLRDKMGLVTRVDRHKKLAYLELDAFGRVLRVKVGLDVIKKS